MRATILLGLATALLMGARASATEESQADSQLAPSDLVGAYTVVSGEEFGHKVPDERVAGTTVRFTEDRVVVFDKDQKEVYGATYTLDSGQSPCRITMTSKLGQPEEAVALGLIEKEGDTLRLIYALPGGDEPTEFKTKERQLLFEMNKTDQ